MKQKLPPLHKICGNDALRPAFSQIWFTKTRVYVTDCHILMWAERKDFFGKYVLDFQDAPDEFSVSADVWKQLSKFERLVFMPESRITAFGGEAGTYKLNDPKEFKMPDFDVVIPGKFEGQVGRIGLNPELLSKISSIFKADCGNGDCKLDFIAKDKPIGVSPTDSDCIFKAILMPVLINKPIE